MPNINWRKWIPVAMLIVSVLGFVDAASLTIDHYTEANLPCTFTHECAIVTTSAYAEVLGIPVALLGSLYYLTIFLGTCLFFETRSERLLKIISTATIAGLLASAWFVFAQLVLIKAICQYCMVSAGTSTALFVLGMMYLKLSSTPRDNT